MSNPLAWTGSPRCADRRSRTCSTAAACNSRCSTPATWPPSPRPVDPLRGSTPGERLVVCRNPDLAAERARKREELLIATETDLAAIKARVDRTRKPLRGTAEIALAVGAVFNTHKMRKHFDLTITDDAFSFTRKTAEIAAEAATDGLYVVRTSLSEQTLGDVDTVRSYKSLSLVERAFRCIKTVDRNVRPVYHWLEGRVRAHVFLCMLAYYLEWHMRQCLAPMLFDDTDPDEAEARRRSVVAQAQRSKAAIKKQ